MRYIDSGKRNPNDALGSWLAQVVQDPDIIELRLQTGFFSVDGLGHMIPLMAKLRDYECLTRVLIGSNDGVTRRSDIEVLFTLVGSPRQGLEVGVVSFDNSYYHPKTIHLTRNDKSMIAYVGSANLTKSGVSALHIEAGITLDTRDGDDPAALTSVAGAVDWWFEGPGRPGLFQVGSPADLDSLVASKILGLSQTPKPRSPSSKEGFSSDLPKLSPLVVIPSIPIVEAVSTGEESAAVEDDGGAPSLIVVLDEWGKNLTASDAQRKPQGNQRGGITLTQNRYPINPRTYFRQDFFGGALWSAEQTLTGIILESATVPMLVDIVRVNIGSQNIRITHDPAREAAQGNYTTMIHLGPLRPYFDAQDMTGHRMAIMRRNDGTFSLTIE